MDSQEKALNQGTPEENVVSESTEKEVEETLSQKVYKSKSEIIDRLKEIVSGDENPEKDEIDYLKTAFYKTRGQTEGISGGRRRSRTVRGDSRRTGRSVQGRDESHQRKTPEVLPPARRGKAGESKEET